MTHGMLQVILGNCEGKTEIRWKVPGQEKARQKWFPDPASAENYARALDGKAEVWFGAGTRMRDGGGKEAVQEIPGLWADEDDAESVEASKNFLEPTVIVETSPGHQQRWWLFREPLLLESDELINTIEATLRGIAHRLKADPTVAEIARVMRVPGTINVKRNARGKVLKQDGPRYELSDFLALGLPDPKATTADGNGHSRLDVARILEGLPEGYRDGDIHKLASLLRAYDVRQDEAELVCVYVAEKSEQPPGRPFTPEEAREKVRNAYKNYKAGTALPGPVPVIGTQQATTDPTVPTVESWPDPVADTAYRGILGQIVKKVEKHTEADPVAILAQLLVGFGNVVGSGPYYRVEGTQHRVNENLILVGGTADSRKGTSFDQARRILEAVDATWTREKIQSGLSTGEGLIHAVRDRREETKPVMERGRCVDYTTVEVDAGVPDKRLLCYEPEFARVLKVQGRENSILSSIVRLAWDSGHLRVMTRTTGAVATGAHISIVAHITGEELTRLIEQTDAASGFGNRFAWFAVKRARLLPEGSDPDMEELTPLLHQAREAVQFAQGVTEMTRDEQAKALWRKEYQRLSTGRPGLLGAMLNRAPAHVLRMSMIYALADKSAFIRQEHLESAIALWDYAERSARFIFGTKLGDLTADELHRALQAAGTTGLTRTDMSHHFGRNKSAAEIGRALTVLAHQGLARRQDNPERTEGRTPERWFAVVLGEG